MEEQQEHPGPGEQPTEPRELDPTPEPSSSPQPESPEAASFSEGGDENGRGSLMNEALDAEIAAALGGMSIDELVGEDPTPKVSIGSDGRRTRSGR